MRHTAVRSPARARHVVATAPTVEIVVPAHNEASVLEPNVRRLLRHLSDGDATTTTITIVDSGSTDSTPDIARRLAREHLHVQFQRLAKPGRGRAIRAAWNASDADVLAYMDVDLSTDLSALQPLIELIIDGRADVAIGSRLHPESSIVRGPRRELISRAYNHLLQVSLGVGFRDAQCGFKAIRGDVAHRLLPRVADDEWFFDTELLVRAEQEGLRIAEVPVTWVDDPMSSVKLVQTALHNLRAIARLRYQTRRHVTTASR